MGEGGNVVRAWDVVVGCRVRIRRAAVATAAEGAEAAVDIYGHDSTSEIEEREKLSSVAFPCECASSSFESSSSFNTPTAILSLGRDEQRRLLLPLPPNDAAVVSRPVSFLLIWRGAVAA